LRFLVFIGVDLRLAVRVCPSLFLRLFSPGAIVATRDVLSQILSFLVKRLALSCFTAKAPPFASGTLPGSPEKKAFFSLVVLSFTFRRTRESLI